MASTTVPTTRRKPGWVLQHILLGGVAVMLLGSTLGCSSSTPTGQLAGDKQIAATCPAGRAVAARGAIDVSGSRRSVAAEPGRLDPIRELVRFTIVCGGRLRVDVFSGSSAATASVYDGDVHLAGATENARLRREPAMTDQVMTAITKNLPAAAAKLPSGGTDVLAQFGMDAEYLRQLDPDGSRYVLHSVIATDGVQTEQVALTDRALTLERAAQLANQVEAPNLTGADVRLTDVGKTPGLDLPTGYVDVLKAFYAMVCTNSKAARCVVVTDGAGQ